MLPIVGDVALELGLEAVGEVAREAGLEAFGEVALFATEEAVIGEPERDGGREVSFRVAGREGFVWDDLSEVAVPSGSSDCDSTYKMNE